jgi:hypothetical protein
VVRALPISFSTWTTWYSPVLARHCSSRSSTVCGLSSLS